VVSFLPSDGGTQHQTFVLIVGAIVNTHLCSLQELQALLHKFEARLTHHGTVYRSVR